MVYRCKGNLHSDLMAEILEHVIVEFLGVVDCDVSWDAIATGDILLENFLDGGRAYVCNCHTQKF
jgi:hypothetical protein